MVSPVHCPWCRGRFRVGVADIGRLIECPRCGTSFEAVAADGARRSHPDTASPDDPPGDHYHSDTSTDVGWNPALIGLALLSWGIPLGWLVAPLLTGRDPIFSFVAPLAVAFGLTGLGLGIVAAHWSVSTKAKALLALLTVGYFTAGMLHFLKREWAEAIRHNIGRTPGEWKPFVAPRGVYEVRLPGPASATGSPIPGWELTAFQVADKNSSDLFVVAHGSTPGDLPEAEEDWFDRATEAVLAGTGGELRGSPTRVLIPAGRGGNYPGREFVIDLPGQTTRIVRLFRDRDRAFYLAAQGPFWRPDTWDVQQFFRSFRVMGK